MLVLRFSTNVTKIAHFDVLLCNLVFVQYMGRIVEKCDDNNLYSAFSFSSPASNRDICSTLLSTTGTVRIKYVLCVIIVGNFSMYHIT